MYEIDEAGQEPGAVWTEMFFAPAGSSIAAVRATSVVGRDRGEIPFRLERRPSRSRPAGRGETGDLDRPHVEDGRVPRQPEDGPDGPARRVIGKLHVRPEHLSPVVAERREQRGRPREDSGGIGRRDHRRNRWEDSGRMRGSKSAQGDGKKR